MSDNPETRVALVVGAGSGIGRATALKLAASGLRVVAADLNDEAVAKLAAEHEDIVSLGESWDAISATECQRLVAATVAETGRIDHVVSTVGWTAITRFLEESPEYWRRIIDVNLMSAIYLSAAAGEAMRETGGTIVLTSSEAGMVGQSGEAVYSAAKGGIVALAKALAREWARYSIRVNVVAPGVTETPLLESQGGEALLASVVRAIPLRRAGRPEEIADAIAYLSSDEASYVTGQTLCVGGGLTMSS
ncbi:3-oxoacyl-[acyl-carrier protein] reductase/2-hydroxycyclohexanecarboxyl-CoA dehydrogenase [Kribbella sp. VKM Ac-2527]|uniref:3-oxoacyl-[acyl-carrier protein] reductase/2-hydroxycyclohexanecarboxyl-CoA dehydrogenase n=1 Tax=Kribbella caucasensis TaxID=2512215 RepID=A0A4R6KLL7_9ACTN|nr:SDR family NAD(P)-dependent oxidoreductase [Kribbella sp. VKM Ac-2527]TDO51686.1 3-oxoacyl-[acyl-carrier protein] reductase/2-hydroxycyclohexanecarboxyl-CoA dehydrogenase [Kribbella sp. VKM Ac-2527]